MSRPVQAADRLLSGSTIALYIIDLPTMNSLSNVWIVEATARKIMVSHSPGNGAGRKDEIDRPWRVRCHVLTDPA